MSADVQSRSRYIRERTFREIYILNITLHQFFLAIIVQNKSDDGRSVDRWVDKYIDLETNWLIELICKLRSTELRSISYNVSRLERWRKYENLITNEREEKMVR